MKTNEKVNNFQVKIEWNAIFRDRSYKSTMKVKQETKRQTFFAEWKKKVEKNIKTTSYFWKFAKLRWKYWMKKQINRCDITRASVRKMMGKKIENEKRRMIETENNNKEERIYGRNFSTQTFRNEKSEWKDRSRSSVWFGSSTHTHCVSWCFVLRFFCC